MPTVTKSTTLDALGLPTGDHLVRFHVEAEIISFEVAASRLPVATPESAHPRQPTGFVKKWSGTAKKTAVSDDPWLTHINDKHLR
jgi:hypothetical protein